MSANDIPEINLLCMDQRDSEIFQLAMKQHWSSSIDQPKLKINIRDSSLKQLPATTKFQLIVSPANSYARLDGSFDDAISRAFCLPNHPYDTLTKASQAEIYRRWRGFAPPSSCTLVPFPQDLVGQNAWGCEWIAIVPTMRVPDKVTWDREVVYECTWSLLCELERYNAGRETERINSILITPLATGVGGVSRERWASQFVLAMKHFVDALERPQRWSQLKPEDLIKEVSEVAETWDGKSR